MAARYDLHDDGFDNCDMRSTETGEYVLFDDYQADVAKLQAENARLREALKGIMAIAGNPNTIAACRLIIKEARAALGKED